MVISDCRAPMGVAGTLHFSNGAARVRRQGSDNGQHLDPLATGAIQVCEYPLC